MCVVSWAFFVRDAAQGVGTAQIKAAPEATRQQQGVVCDTNNLQHAADGPDCLLNTFDAADE